MSTTRKPLFQGSMKNGETRYVPVPVRNGALGALIGWKDATSSATITLELTSGEAAYGAGQAWEWKDSAVTITGPAASAAGAFLLSVENVRHQRAQLKIVAAAVCSFEIWDGTA